MQIWSKRMLSVLCWMLNKGHLMAKKTLTPQRLLLQLLWCSRWFLKNCQKLLTSIAKTFWTKKSHLRFQETLLSKQRNAPNISCPDKIKITIEWKSYTKTQNQKKSQLLPKKVFEENVVWNLGHIYRRLLRSWKLGGYYWSFDWGSHQGIRLCKL